MRKICETKKKIVKCIYTYARWHTAQTDISFSPYFYTYRCLLFFLLTELTIIETFRNKDLILFVKQQQQK